MIVQPSISLPIVDGLDLPSEMRQLLRPGEPVRDAAGAEHPLPRFFFEVESWEQALTIQLAPHFGLWELIDVDFREPAPVRLFPRYIPCAIVLLAAHLQVLRQRVGTVVRIAANGGYRSPAHAFSRTASPHSWGTAANIYRIGDELMDNEERIEKYARLARRTLPGVWTRSYGDRPGDAFDHVHIDIGFTTLAPRATSSEAEHTR